MKIKIPDEYASGSKPLDDIRERLVKSLVTLSIDWAAVIFKSDDFIEILKLKNISSKEKNRILLELTMFNLFVISIWMSNNYKNNCKEALDRMYFHFSKAMSDNDTLFHDLVEERYLYYDKALKNQAGLGVMYNLGKEVLQYVLGKEEKNIDFEVRMKAPWFFADQMLTLAEKLKKLKMD